MREMSRWVVGAYWRSSRERIEPLIGIDQLERQMLVKKVSIAIQKAQPDTEKKSRGNIDRAPGGSGFSLDERGDGTHIGYLSTRRIRRGRVFRWQ